MEDLPVEEMSLLLLFYVLKVGKETILLMMFDLQMTYKITTKDSTRKTLIIRHHQQIFVFPLSGSLRGNFEESVRRGGVSEQEIMRFEAMRIKSFYNLHIQNSPIRLANSGFYATGDGDEVRCFSCGARRRDWRRGDDPRHHTHHHRHCRHAQRLDESNVNFADDPLPYYWASRAIRHGLRHDPNSGVPPCISSRRIEDDPLIRYRGDLGVYNALKVILKHPEHATREVSGSSHEGGEAPSQTPPQTPSQTPPQTPSQTPPQTPSQTPPQTPSQTPPQTPPQTPSQTPPQTPSQTPPQTPSQTPPQTPPQTTGFDIREARFFNQRDIHARIHSFQGSRHTHDPLTLACAGFFYTGDKDCVRCFHCGLGLRDWEPHDDPWVEHIRYRPSCAHVQAMAGASFVQQTLENISRNHNVILNSSAANQEPEANQNRRDITQQNREHLRQENEDLKNSRKCKVCIQHDASIVFLPCGHLVTCAECAPALMRCPVCRQSIRGTVRAHLTH